MTVAIDPARSLVLAVGLERYEYGKVMDLPGAAEEANRFAQWAVGCGVPPERVLLACTRLDDSAPAPTNVTSIGTTREQLEKVIIGVDRLPGDLLMIFWCGHGVLNERDERALFTSDATPAHKTNVLVDEVSRYLASSRITGYSQQIMLIDACANFVQEMAFDAGLPRHTLPGGMRRIIGQDEYFSAAVGQFAGFDPIRRQATFSTAALEWLEQHSAGVLPPDIKALTRHVDGVMADLREAGGHQTPVYRRVRLSGNLEIDGAPVGDDARPAAPDSGAVSAETILEAIERLGSPASGEQRVRAKAREFASVAARHGRAQLSEHGRNSLLQLRFRAASEDVVAQLPNVRPSAHGGEARPANLTGELDDIADVYRRTPGWLVVLGEAGAGKSVLAQYLAVRLLGSRRPGEKRIPVVLNVHSWHPEVTLDQWLADSLIENFHSLAETGPDKTSLAAALVEAEYILPILDGFDEILPGRRNTFLRELNHTSTPLVLTSRTEAYAEAVRAGVAIEGADVIVLHDLTLDDLRRYLPLTTGTRTVRDKWESVFGRLAEEPGAPADVSALASPLMAGLARVIYGDVSEDPAELLDSSRRRLRDANQLKAHLLNRFVAAVYARSRGRWTGEDAERWLGYLAQRQGPGEFAWWKVVNSVPRRQRAGAFLVPSAILGAAAGGLRLGWAGAILGGLLVGILGAWVGSTDSPQPERLEFRIRGRAKHALFQLVPGVVGGLIVGIVGFFLVRQWGWMTLAFAGAVGNAVGGGLTGWARHRAWKANAKPILREILLGIGGGAAGAFAVGLIGQVAHAPRGQGWILWLSAGLIVGVAFTPGAGLLAEPSVETILTPAALLKSNRSYALLQTVMVAGTFGVAVYIFTDVASGTVFGCAIGIAFGAGVHAWGRWLIIGRCWLPLTGRLPGCGVWDFLEDAHRRGVLRQEGAVYAFRHALLRETLATRYLADNPTRFWSD